jgi:hypothetical protein
MDKVNGAINVGSSILARPRSRWAEVDPAPTSDELAEKVSEAGSPTPSGVGVVT